MTGDNPTCEKQRNWIRYNYYRLNTHMVLQDRVFMGGLGLYIIGPRWYFRPALPHIHISGAGATHRCGLAHLSFLMRMFFLVHILVSCTSDAV